MSYLGGFLFLEVYNLLREQNRISTAPSLFQFVLLKSGLLISLNKGSNMTLSVDVFTNQYLLELEPREKEYIVSEVACKGFSVRVFPSPLFIETEPIM